MCQPLRGTIGTRNVFKSSSRGGRLLTNNERLLGSVLALLSFFGGRRCLEKHANKNQHLQFKDASCNEQQHTYPIENALLY